MKKESKKTLLFFILIVLGLTLLGFLGYKLGFMSFIYNIALPKAFSNYNIIILSIILGIAAFFSPCAFTVLPSYITHYLTNQVDEKSQKLTKALYLGFLGALGIIVVNMVVGLVIASLGSAAPFSKDPRNDIPIILGVRILAGLIITGLGIMTLSGKAMRIPFIQNFISKAGFNKSMFYYGIFYNAAAVGCTGPIMLGLMLFAFSTGSFVGAITAFGVFSLTMGILMIIVTLLVGVFKGYLIKNMIQALPKIKIIAGITMIIVGLFLVILTLEGNKIFVDIFFPHLI